jgi:eukaryotic-like serine/threonine-protein kinase
LSTYRVDSELGRGGMAVVYSGWHEQLDRPVALKVLAEHLAGHAEFRNRFLREARIAARLHHPSLVRTFDITEIGGLPCIVMELVGGGTLEGGRLTRDEAARVAEGLAYAHEQGVIHRDLKPANLLRARPGEVKIADFGIARAAEETMVTQIGTVLGTLRYLSPEQAAGTVVGPATDVYALGMVLDELLDERTPELRTLIDRARAQEPDSRPTAAEAAAVLRGETLVAPTVVMTQHTSRSWTPLVLAAAAAAAVIAAIAVAATGGSGQSSRVQPVRHGTSAAAQADNLGQWLETYSR